MIYKVTFGFSGRQGWGETHAMLSPANNPIDLIPQLSDIATKRVQMLGREFHINMIRISRYATEAGVRAKGVKLHKQVFANSNQGLTGRAEPAAVALLAEATAKPSGVNPQFDANTNRTFLGAPLDISVDAAGQVFEGNGGLGAAFLSWSNAMIQASMGWLASQVLIDTEITTITKNLNGTVQLVTAGPLLPTLTQGAVYRARIRRVNAGVSPLNGEVMVSCDDNLTLTTMVPIGLALAQAGGFIKVYKAVSPFVQYGTLTLAQTVGNHKRGAPFGSQRGRRRKRVRG